MAFARLAMTNWKTLKTTKRPTPTLRLNPTAWAKLLFLRDHRPTGIGGVWNHGRRRSLVPGRRGPGATTYVGRVGRVRRCGRGRLLRRPVDAGRRPEQFARIWLRTHPGDCPRPSSTDEDTFDRVFGRVDWAVMFILAAGGRDLLSVAVQRGTRWCTGDRFDRRLAAAVWAERL